VTAPPGASPEAAAVAAAHRALAGLHPDQVTSLDAHRVASLAAIADGPAKDAGIAVGEAAALAVLAKRTDDGSNDDTPYSPGTAPGRYRPTPPDFTPAFRPGLGQVDTFAIKSGAQFRVDPPPALRSARYTRDYNEVKKVGELHSDDRPPDRAAVARFYAVNDAVQIYFPAARQVSQAQGRTLAENARTFALLGLAIFDAVVACFDSKYFYDFWRPVTAIHLADHDGNRKTEADANWATFVPTPPFPSYPSGHAAFGAAARRVLERTLGAGGHAITLASPLVPDVVLRYTSWKQITDDVDDARIYGGVHYRFDQQEAAWQGRRVGTYVLRHWLRPGHRHTDTAARSIERRSAGPVSRARKGGRSP
jgi:PAP2 superfamily